MVIFTVYKITCLITNKLYIGYTKNNIYFRLKGHFKTARKITNKKNKMANAILKYGTINFKIESLFETHNKQEALDKEVYLIKQHDTINKGYNTTSGGEIGYVITGRTLSEDHKNNIRIANIGRVVTNETRKLISQNHSDVSGKKNPFFNKKHSIDSRQKISKRKYLKGKDHHFYGKRMATSFKEGKNHPKSQPIVIDGVEYGSLTLAAKALGTYRQKIKELYLN